MPFDYTRAVSLNQAALRLVVEEIFVFIEMALNGGVKRLPLILQQAAYRLLVPAESALRRLIVIAACGLKVRLAVTQSQPPISRITTRGSRPLSFQLYDTRKRFGRNMHVKSPIPRLHFFDGQSLVSISAPKTKTQSTSLQLCRRFVAFRQALENIPREAKRLALWQAKRAKLAEAKFRFPLRPGAPPGFRRSLAHAIDGILKECHALSLDELREAPS